MLLHMYVIFTSRYCSLSKCTQYDSSCRRALKHYSFIHSLKSWMSLIMGLIGLERLELFALELGKNAIFDCLHSSMYNY